MSEHPGDSPALDPAEPASPPQEPAGLGSLDVELGTEDNTAVDDAPEQPPADSHAQDDSPPPFAFPTAEQVAAQQHRAVEMVVADDLGGFESVSLGDRENQQDEEVDLNRFSSIALEGEGEEDTTPVATEAEDAEEDADSSSTEPTATPSLSQSLSTTPPTTAPSSKVALPASSEAVSVVAPEEPQSPTVASKDIEVSKHVQAPSKGASVMQKVVSMTRQRDLPVRSSHAAV